MPSQSICEPPKKNKPIIITLLVLAFLQRDLTNHNEDIFSTNKLLKNRKSNLTCLVCAEKRKKCYAMLKVQMYFSGVSSNKTQDYSNNEDLSTVTITNLDTSLGTPNCNDCYFDEHRISNVDVINISSELTL